MKESSLTHESFLKHLAERDYYGYWSADFEDDSSSYSLMAFGFEEHEGEGDFFESYGMALFEDAESLIEA